MHIIFCRGIDDASEVASGIPGSRIVQTMMELHDHLVTRTPGVLCVSCSSTASTGWRTTHESDTLSLSTRLVQHALASDIGMLHQLMGRSSRPQRNAGPPRIIAPAAPAESSAPERGTTTWTLVIATILAIAAVAPVIALVVARIAAR